MSRMTFFDPKDAFLIWLKQHAGDRPVFDVGCGNGRFLERLWTHNIKAMGIDKFAYDSDIAPDTLLRVLQQDATRCKTLQQHPGLVLFCRPNHTGWVADTVLTTHPESEVLYISKPENLPQDLPDFTVETVKAPGCRVETVYRVLRPFPKFTAPHYQPFDLDRMLDQVADTIA